MEVLFEFEGSRCPLKSDSSESILDLVLIELKKYNQNACICISTREESCVGGSGSRETYILQRWCVKWKTHVNVERIEEIQDGDRLTVVAKPSTKEIVSFNKHAECGVHIKI